jgi:hypothetical protein
MDDRTQRMLMRAISLILSQALAQPLTSFIGEKIPERRGIKDDIAEAVLKGATRTVAYFIASVIVRKIAASR